MQSHFLTQDVKGKNIHMVGVKGVGMTALAEILLQRGARLTGSDTSEVFFTDEILKRLRIPVTEFPSPDTVTPKTDLVIHSAAYSADSNPQLIKARKLSIPCLLYPEALGLLSASYDATAICGVHGKTTTTALTGFLLKLLGLPATALVGSQVPDFDNFSTFQGGDTYFIAETCEYKRHFLYFKPRSIILTSVEEDHQDYFNGIEDIYKAFTDFVMLLPSGGTLIFCADDPGAGEVVSRVSEKRSDITYIPYGIQATGDFRIVSSRIIPGTIFFHLSGIDCEFSLHLPGKHSIANATAAVALVCEICRDHHRQLTQEDTALIQKGLASFSGTRRRSELIGEAGDILFMDDYAHHPTAIRSTLEGIKGFFPHRRLVVDFMSHTYSRTAALLSEFAGSFTAADQVILHRIYASAREKKDGTVSGEILYHRTKKQHPSVLFFPSPSDAFPYLKEYLVSGDLFLTMGAGDNWKLSHDLYRYFLHQGDTT